MPTFNFTSPEGKSYQIDGPEGATQDQAFQILQQHIGAGGGGGGEAQKPTLPKEQQMGMARGAAHEFLAGIPIGGPLGQKGLDAANAYFSGDPNKSFSENYATAGKERKEQEEDFENRHPYVSTGSQLAGGVGTMLAGGSTLLGARMLGLVGSMPQMIGVGALAGGAIGATDAALRDQNPLTGAGIGVAAGAGGPVLGKAVSTVAEPIVNHMRAAFRPGMEANRVVGSSLLEGRPGKPVLTQEQFENNPATRVIDMGDEVTRDVARSAANHSGEARSMINEMIDSRVENKAARTQDFINHTFHYPDAAKQQAAIDQASKIATGNAYPAAYAAGDQRFPGGFVQGVHPELDRLLGSPDVQSAMATAAKSLPGMNVAAGGTAMKPPAHNMQLMDMTYRLLRDNGNEMFRKGQGTLGTSLSNQANAFRDVLDKMVPEYGAARSTAAEYFSAGNALEAGKNLASAAKPDIAGAQQAFSQMNAQEKKLFHDGYLSQLIENARNAPDRGNYLAKVNNTENKRQAMLMALGPDDAKKVETFLHVEGIMEKARRAVQGNSTTAQQIFNSSLAGGLGSTLETGGNPFDPAGFLHGALLYGGLRYGHNVVQERVMRQVADLLTSRDLNRVRIGMGIANRNANVFKAIQHADAALGSIGTETAGQHLRHQIASIANTTNIGQQMGNQGAGMVADAGRIEHQ